MPPPLTDDELAAIGGKANRAASMLTMSYPEAVCATVLDVPRLIADLCASRTEVERLREQNDGLYQASLMLRAEVERLKADRGVVA